MAITNKQTKTFGQAAAMVYGLDLNDVVDSVQLNESVDQPTVITFHVFVTPEKIKEISDLMLGI